MRLRLRPSFLLAVLLLACGDPPPAGDDDAGARPDSASSDAAAPACTTSAECDDGRFCNGVERCAPTELAADARGCAPGPTPCPGRCQESTARCLEGCALPDADGDGSIAIECGGDDCDDDDPQRFPGNVEVCDAAGRDEDCDPSTLGHDLDRDGHVDDRCCNLQPDGALLCGTDCDDLRDAVRPGATDVCNGIDDDCDGVIDEEPTLVFYTDADGDGWGVAGSPDDLTLPESVRPVRACARPDGYTLQPGDCDDDDPRAHPGSLELCGGGDEDCDGSVDEYGPGVATPAIDPRLWYVDADRDGWGNTNRVALGCVPPVDGRTYTTQLGDCRDDRPDVHPGITTPQQLPSCPEDFVQGDMVFALIAQHCESGWQCTSGQPDFPGPCDEYPFLDAWWDLNCSGTIETFPIATAWAWIGGDECTGLGNFRPAPDQCGMGTTYPEGYGPPAPPPDCQAPPLGELGAVRCM